jgi:hypothetical protein
LFPFAGRRFRALLLVGIILHGLWDFTLFASRTADGAETSEPVMAGVQLEAQVAFIIVAVASRRTFVSDSRS